MPVYKCDICQYETHNMYNLKKHKLTQKHLRKANSVCKEEVKNECTICHKMFTTLNRMSRHMKSCVKKRVIENEYNIGLPKDDKLSHEILLKDTKIELLEDQNKQLKEDLKSLRLAIMSNGIMAQSASSAIKYLTQNYGNAPPLKRITDGSEFKRKKETIDAFVENLIDHYVDNTLVIYIGDYIINNYKKSDGGDQSLWNSDTKRLTYAIKESINKNKSEWQIDKDGLNTKEYLVNPIMEYIQNCIQKYYKKHEKNEKDTSDSLILKSKKIGYLMKIERQIEDKTLHKGVLKYIAPTFYLQRDRMSVQFERI